MILWLKMRKKCMRVWQKHFKTGMYVCMCACGSERVQGVKRVCLLYTSSPLYIWSESCRKTTPSSSPLPNSSFLLLSPCVVCNSVCLYTHDSTLREETLGSRAHDRRTSRKVIFCKPWSVNVKAGKKRFKVPVLNYSRRLFRSHSLLHWRKIRLPQLQHCCISLSPSFAVISLLFVMKFRKAFTDTLETDKNFTWWM